jgi:hypothetical protein
MEKLKELSKELIVKIKLIIGIVIAGLVVGAVAWRKHVQDELAKQDQEKELKIQQEALVKLVAEKAKLDEEKKTEQAKIETEAKEKQVKLDEEKKVEENKLKKADNATVKKAAAEALGLKEGKKKGRPKK